MINPEDIEIEGPHSHLTISDDDPRDEGETRPIMLYIPDGREAEHSHIELTLEGAKTLFDWLGRWLADG